MTNLLLKLFIKNSDDINDPSVRSAYGTLAGAVGIITNMLIAGIKLFIGIISSSVAVTADAVNNLSDAGSSLVTLVGFRLSGRPADRKHPYGHARYEYLTGLFVSVIIVFLGGTFFIDSIKKIVSKNKSSFGWTMIIVLGLSILLKFWQCVFYKKLGKKIKSASLKASAADSRNDCIMTLTVLIGAICGKLFDIAIDGYIGCAVALFILIAGIRLIADTSNPLIGVAPDEETVKNIESIIMSDERILGMHDMLIHSYGANRIFCSAHAEVNANDNILSCHDVIDNIEERAYNELGVFLVIHMDPISVGDVKINEMKESLGNILSEFDEKCTFHDFRVIFGDTHDNVIFDIAVPYGIKESNDEVIETVSKKFTAKYPKSVMKIKVENDYTGRLDR